MAQGHTRMFIKQLITNPISTGAVAPSSAELAKNMVEYAAPGAGAVIAELGPGTGVITERILETLQPGQRFFAIEINEKFAEMLRRRFPQLHLYQDCASTIADCCRREGVGHVDTVISGLPWAIFPEELQEKILDGMMEVIPAGGVFVTFAYLQGLIMPSARLFKKHLKKRFAKVESSGVIWKNIPPAIMYRCQK